MQMSEHNQNECTSLHLSIEVALQEVEEALKADEQAFSHVRRQGRETRIDIYRSVLEVALVQAFRLAVRRPRR